MLLFGDLPASMTSLPWLDIVVGGAVTSLATSGTTGSSTPRSVLNIWAVAIGLPASPGIS